MELIARLLKSRIPQQNIPEKHSDVSETETTKKTDINENSKKTSDRKLGTSSRPVKCKKSFREEAGEKAINIENETVKIEKCSKFDEKSKQPMHSDPKMELISRLLKPKALDENKQEITSNTKNNEKSEIITKRKKPSKKSSKKKTSLKKKMSRKKNKEELKKSKSIAKSSVSVKRIFPMARFDCNILIREANFDN